MSGDQGFPSRSVRPSGGAAPALTNADLAELLGRASDVPEDHRRRALQRAARAALMWPEEVATLHAQGRPLTELHAVGPWIAGLIEAWLRDPPDDRAPPQIRQGFLTRAEALAVLSSRLDVSAALRSDLQMHTTFSDGRASLRDMAEASGARGYEHVAITDHSVGLPIAGGMSEDILARQGREIDQLNEEFERIGRTVRLLKSIEMNLSPEGAGDMSAEALGSLDLVLGAFHSKLRVTEDQTERYLAAIRNPTVHVIAHPRGRRYNVRLGLRADWPRVFRAAAEHGTALEIDAFPDRQDLDVELLTLANGAGVYVSIGTDAHAVADLRFMEFGLAAAVLAGIPTSRILNFMAREELQAWARASRPS